MARFLFNLLFFNSSFLNLLFDYNFFSPASIKEVKQKHKGFQSNKIKVIVKPSSPKNEILGYDEARQAYRVAIKAPAEKGKANTELIKFFKKLTKKNIQIVSGFKSKEKVLMVEITH